ncbi:MAG: hypothetical protein E6G92_14815 [Alphaproteobacteria bacterium]|nr:MAG: hypothetical protein E6G92_14815 [Alphaproteobacteria bacterium]
MKRILLTATCLLMSTAAPADVTVYRATTYKNGTFALVNDAQWRIDADGLSTFELANFAVTNKRCQVAFVIEGVQSQPDAGTQGPVDGLPDGYVGEYTPLHGGEGHWSIHGPAETLPATLKALITANVIARRSAARNQGYAGRSQSLCETPLQPNLGRRRR